MIAFVECDYLGGSPLAGPNRPCALRAERPGDSRRPVRARLHAWRC